MAHEVESMFSVSETPWHNLGTILEEAPTCDEAIKCAGLDWDVKLQPLTTPDGTIVTHQATTRMSDNKVLGVVGPSYKILQNHEAFAFFNPIVEAGEAKLETAGSLRGGSRIWILAQLNRDPSVIVGDDIVRKYVLLSNSHDGTLAVKVGFTPIRVVCANTLAMAHNDSSSKLLRIKHTGNVSNTLETVRDAINFANAEFEATADIYRKLAATPIVEADLKKYVKKVFSQVDEKPSLTVTSLLDTEFLKEEEDARSRVFNRIHNLFENGRGNNVEGVRGTMWAAYNSVTEFLAYERGNARGDVDIAERRLNEGWFGTGKVLNMKALKTAIAMAA